MSWREFNLWRAYLNQQDRKDQEQFAVLLTTIINMSGKSLAKGQEVTVEQLMGGGNDGQTMEQQIAVMKGLGK